MTGFWERRDSIIWQPGREGAPMIVKWALSWLTLRWTRYRLRFMLSWPRTYLRYGVYANMRSRWVLRRWRLP